MSLRNLFAKTSSGSEKSSAAVETKVDKTKTVKAAEKPGFLARLEGALLSPFNDPYSRDKELKNVSASSLVKNSLIRSIPVYVSANPLVQVFSAIVLGAGFAAAENGTFSYHVGQAPGGKDRCADHIYDCLQGYVTKDDVASIAKDIASEFHAKVADSTDPQKLLSDITIKKISEKMSSASGAVVATWNRIVADSGTGAKPASEGTMKALRGCMDASKMQKVLEAALNGNSEASFITKIMNFISGEKTEGTLDTCSLSSDIWEKIITKGSIFGEMTTDACDAAKNEFASQVLSCQNWKTEGKGVLWSIVGGSIALAVVCAAACAYVYCKDRCNQRDNSADRCLPC